MTRSGKKSTRNFPISSMCRDKLMHVGRHISKIHHCLNCLFLKSFDKTPFPLIYDKTILYSRNQKTNYDREKRKSNPGSHDTNIAMQINITKEAVCLLVGCVTSQQHASVSQGRICSDNFTCCHIEIEVADQIFHLTQSQYTDTRPTSPSTDPITPGACQGSHWSANF